MTKVKKAPIDPDRIRTIPPEGFSWIDRRFVREGFMNPLQKDVVLLYLFLTAVSDAQGISFYADATVGKLLKLTIEGLKEARSQLIDRKLILYRYPLYQVLPLPEHVKVDPPAESPPTTQSPEGELMSLREFFKLIGRERPSRKE